MNLSKLKTVGLLILGSYLGFACEGDDDALLQDAAGSSSMDSGLNETPNDSDASPLPPDDAGLPDAATLVGTPLETCPVWELEINSALPSSDLVSATVVDGNLQLDVEATTLTFGNPCPLSLTSDCNAAIVSRQQYVSGDFDITIDLSSYSGAIATTGNELPRGFVFFYGDSTSSGTSYVELHSYEDSFDEKKIAMRMSVNSYEINAKNGTFDGFASARLTRVGDQMSIATSNGDGITHETTRPFPTGPGRLGVGIQASYVAPTHIEFSPMIIHTSEGELVCDWNQ